MGSPFVAGCMPTDQTGANGLSKPPSRPTGTLRVAAPLEPTSLDPALAAGPADFAVIYAIYETLLRFRGDTVELEGCLAENYSSSQDAREWTFQIKNGITFHDGRRSTPQPSKPRSNTSRRHRVSSRHLPKLKYDRL